MKNQFDLNVLPGSILLRLVFSAILLLSSFKSFGQSKKVLDSWIGSTEQQMIKQWGPPTKAVSDGGEGKVLVYSSDYYQPAMGHLPTISYTDFTYIYVNKLGKIYTWKKERKQTVPTQVDLNLR